MGKNKKVSEKVKLFYRGPAYKPIRSANEDDAKYIIETLKECFPHRSKIFTTSDNIRLKLNFGLSSSLRALKSRKTKAVIYDDTINIHVANHLNSDARKLNLPIIQVKGLRAISCQLTQLLIVSLVDAATLEGEEIRNEGVDKLYKLLKEFRIPDEEKPVFKLPVLEKVTSSGKSREKKRIRRAAQQQQQQTHVVRTKMSKKQRHQGKRK